MMQARKKKWGEWDGLLAYLAFFFIAFSVLMVGLNYSFIYASFFFDGAATTGTITACYTYRTIGRGVSYKNRLRYVYVVDGVHYQCENLKLAPGHAFVNRHEARQQINHYKAGQKVTVHYDKRFPRLAALKTETGWSAWGVPLAGFLLGVLCIFIFKKCGYTITFK